MEHGHMGYWHTQSFPMSIFLVGKKFDLSPWPTHPIWSMSSFKLLFFIEGFPKGKVITECLSKINTKAVFWLKTEFGDTRDNLSEIQAEILGLHHDMDHFLFSHFHTILVNFLCNLNTECLKNQLFRYNFLCFFWRI